MDNERKEKANAMANETMNKLHGIWATCKEKIDTLLKSGIKSKAIGIASVMVLAMLMQSGCSCNSDFGRDWEYTGKGFIDIFMDGVSKDEGVVYRKPFYTFFNITVIQATRKGNLVTVNGADRLIWVETKRRHEDGEELDTGYYIRRGLHEYTTALGAEKTVPRYVEVTDKKMLEQIEKTNQELEAKKKAEEEAEEAERRALEAQRKAEEEAKKKAREEAAEQGAYELDIPIKSLCGFKLGVPPSQVRPLLQNDDGTPVQDCALGQATYRLAKPFRLFTHATVRFYDSGVGMHLICVRLKADISNVSRESWTQEIITVANLIEKKFGITFRRYGSDGGVQWKEDGGNDSAELLISIDGIHPHILELKFSAYQEIKDLDYATKKAREEAGKKTINLDATAGADEL